MASSPTLAHLSQNPGGSLSAWANPVSAGRTRSFCSRQAPRLQRDSAPRAAGSQLDRRRQRLQCGAPAERTGRSASARYPRPCPASRHRHSVAGTGSRSALRMRCARYLASNEPRCRGDAWGHTGTLMAFLPARRSRRIQTGSFAHHRDRLLRSLDEGLYAQAAGDSQRLLQPPRGHFSIPLVALIQTALIQDPTLGACVAYRACQL